MRSFPIKTPYLLAIAAVASAMLMLWYPAQSLAAAVRGLAIWWDVLFPALFPFFLISEMLIGLGIVHLFGTLLDPIMRPLFRIPGIGGFVMAMGFASGYPVGARLTSRLWEQKLINREEGERLVAMTTSSDPIFLIGAVSVGFFMDGRLAAVLAASHYGAAILIGLLMRFTGKGTPTDRMEPTGGGSLLRRSAAAMYRARLQDGRPLGLLLQQAIQSSLQLIFVVGGLVVFFSVLMETLSLSHILDIFYSLVNGALHALSLPPVLSEALVNGFFEVTLGAKSAGQAGGAVPLVDKTAIAAFVLSWGGISVHAQVMSLLHHTNLRYIPFVLARLAHGILAFGLVYVFWKPLAPSGELPAFIQGGANASRALSPASLMWQGSAAWAAAVLLLLAAALFVFFVLQWISNKLYNEWHKSR